MSIVDEDLITFSEVCRILPKRRQGRKPVPSTLWRWSVKGIAGVHLETVKIGGARMTSRQALRRFFASVTIAKSNPTQRRVITKAARERRQQKVEKELQALGL